MIKCKQCGQECSDSDAFCSSCGAKLEKEQKYCCPKCGNIFTGKKDFCNQCGSKLVYSDVPVAIPVDESKPVIKSVNKAKAEKVLKSDSKEPLWKIIVSLSIYGLIMILLFVAMFGDTAVASALGLSQSIGFGDWFKSESWKFANSAQQSTFVIGFMFFLVAFIGTIVFSILGTVKSALKRRPRMEFLAIIAAIQILYFVYVFNMNSSSQTTTAGITASVSFGWGGVLLLVSIGFIIALYGFEMLYKAIVEKRSIAYPIATIATMVTTLIVTAVFALPSFFYRSAAATISYTPVSSFIANYSIFNAYSSAALSISIAANSMNTISLLCLALAFLFIFLNKKGRFFAISIVMLGLSFAFYLSSTVSGLNALRTYINDDSYETVYLGVPAIMVFTLIFYLLILGGLITKRVFERKEQ